MNASNFFNATTRPTSESPVTRVLRMFVPTQFVVNTFGILPNLWMLLAILTSKDIRSRMRNKFVCSFCVLHLSNSLLFTPARIIIWNWFNIDEELGCHLKAVSSNILLMQDFVANWTLVLLMTIFIAQICEFKPFSGLTHLTKALGTYALLALPWAASVITIPAITTSRSERVEKTPNSSLPRICVRLYDDAYLIFKSLDTAVPLLIAVALIVAAVALRRRRFTGGLSSGMKGELLDRGLAIDNHFGYTAAVVVMLFSDLPDALRVFEVFDINLFHRLIYRVVSVLMSETKVTLSVLPWLLFPDIRERIKTWRPWRRARPGRDLTVVFKKEIS